MNHKRKRPLTTHKSSSTKVEIAMWVVCHFCNCSWEVIPFDEWVDEFVYCGYCGHRHTKEMCAESGMPIVITG